MMLFETPDDRARFFACGEAELGDAIRHAASVDLGIWGDGERLRQDVARILQLEIRSHVRHLVLPDVEEILATEAFQRAYCAARGGREQDLGMALASVARSRGNSYLAEAAERHMRTSVPDVVDAPSHRGSIAEAVLREFQRRRQDERERPWAPRGAV